MGRPKLYFTAAEQNAAQVRWNREWRRRRRERQKEAGKQAVGERYPRHEFDLYVTPPEVIEAALEIVTIEPASVLDVGANDGRWGTVAKSRWPAARVSGVELRETARPEGFDRWYVGDFLEGAKWLPPCDLVIGNPPYAAAEPFIRAALNLLGEGGQVCFLLQSQFLHSQSRRWGLFTEHPLRRLYPLARRVSYHSGCGGTRDATAFLWEQGYHGPEEMFRGRY